jgi:superfamily II RNA helicase
MIISREFHPVIVFSFSRRECEEHPKALQKLDFTNDDQKAGTKTIVRHVIDTHLNPYFSSFMASSDIANKSSICQALAQGGDPRDLSKRASLHAGGRP